MNLRRIIEVGERLKLLQEDQRQRAEQIRNLRDQLRQACSHMPAREMFVRQNGQVWRITNMEPDNLYYVPSITPVQVLDVFPTRECTEDH